MIYSHLFLFMINISSLLWVSTSARAEPKVYRLALEASHIPFNRDFLFPGIENWDYQIRLLWDVGYGRWWMDNDVTGRTQASRFRYVAWEFTTGIKLFDGIDIIQYHKSQHAIDWERKNFPVIDGYGLRVTFIDRPR